MSESVPKHFCEGCHYLQKEQYITEFDCIAISWRCEKRGINIYYQIIHSEKCMFEHFRDSKIEVTYRANIEKCSVRMVKTAQLSNFFHENSQKT